MRTDILSTGGRRIVLLLTALAITIMASVTAHRIGKDSGFNQGNAVGRAIAAWQAGEWALAYDAATEWTELYPQRPRDWLDNLLFRLGTNPVFFYADANLPIDIRLLAAEALAAHGRATPLSLTTGFLQQRGVPMDSVRERLAGWIRGCASRPVDGQFPACSRIPRAVYDRYAQRSV